MISMHEIGSSSGAAKYFDKSFNQDGVGQADNYYINEKAAAVWQGRGAEILGVAGQTVKREDFVEALDGKIKNPADGKIQDLSSNSKGDDRRAGYDFTVAPSKSVSIIALVGNDERIVDAHLAANERAMAWLEKNAAVIRVFDENGERTTKQAGNLLYATVLHETNRNNEPQLHSHNVIVSAVYDEDSKKWRSLTNDQLLILRQGADVVYKSELAQGLQRAGYQLNYDKNGVDFEISGLTRDHIEAYSTRTVEMKKALSDRGVNSDEADYHQRQIATINSRAAKNEQPREVLQSVWQDVAEIARLDVGAITKEARSISEEKVTINEQSGEAIVNAAQKANALNAVSWAVAHLSEREQSFSRAEIEVMALKFGSTRIDEIEQAVDKKIEAGLLIERGVSNNGTNLITTNTAVINENELIGNIRDGIGKGRAVLTNEADFNTALKTYESRKSQELGNPFKLSGEQIEMARNILMHGDVYQGVQGDAGTGKTTALEMAREITEAKGWLVMGIATSSSAAKELEASSGISSQTVASYLNERDNALRLAKLELSELRGALYKIDSSPLPRAEIHKLSIKADGVELGATRYAFDYERGEVFKSPDDLRNKLGNFLLDVASRQKDELSIGAAGAESLAGRLRERTVAGGSHLAGALGTRLTTYEKVGTVEAISARDALHIKLDDEVGVLRFKVGAKQAEITNLQKTGNKAGKKIMLVMDESSMTGVRDAATISRLAKDIEARVVFQGDIKQHGSVPAGRAFEQALQAGMNKSVLQETRRFVQATEQTKESVVLMNTGKMALAIDRLDRIEVKDIELHKTTADRYLKNIEDLKAHGISNPNVGIVTVTNDDRKAINVEVHKALVQNGNIIGESLTKQHLDNLKLTEAQQLHAGMLRAASVDHLVFRKSYKEIGVGKNDVVRVTGFDSEKNTVTIVNSHGKEITINPKQNDYFTPAKMETREYGVGDKVEARNNIHFEGTKMGRVDNGQRGVITAIDEYGATIKWQGASAGNKSVSRELRLNNNQLRMVDLSYARTTFKEQGATNDREIIAVSEKGAKVFNEQAAYVAGTRAKNNSEIVTSDYDTMLKNSGKVVSKTTAIDIEDVKNKGRKGPVKEVLKDNAKIHENVNSQHSSKTKEKEQSQERSRMAQQGMVLE